MYRSIAFKTMKRVIFKTNEAAAIQSGAMERRDHSKNAESPKSQTSRGNLRLTLLMSFSMAVTSLLGQVTDPKEELTEMISNVSSIVECDAKMLGLIFSIGLEVISNYQEVIAELNQKQNLVDLFSYRINGGKGTLQQQLDQFNLDITSRELGEEIVKHVGHTVTAWGRSDIRNGIFGKKIEIPMLEIYTKEKDFLENEYAEAEKVLLENIKVIEFIPPDYRYPLALSTMLGFVRNFRATTWKECLDLYEEWFHRKKMEQINKPPPPVVIEKGSPTFRIFESVLDLLLWGVESGYSNWSKDAFQ